MTRETTDSAWIAAAEQVREMGANCRGLHDKAAVIDSQLDPQ